MAERNVERAVFVSDQPGQLFRGSQQAAGPTLSAAQLQTIVREVAPPHLQAQLSQGRTELPYQTTSGTFRLVWEANASTVRLAVLATPDPGATEVIGVEARATAPVPSPQLKHTLQIDSRVRAVAFSPVAEIVAVGAMDGNITIWNTASGALLHTLKGQGKLRDVGGVLGLAFSPNGKILASVHFNEVRLWFTETWRQRTALTEKAGFMGVKMEVGSYMSVAYAPDGKSVAAGTASGTVKVWNTANEELLYKVGHGGLIGGAQGMALAAFAPDGQVLATGFYRDIILWDAATGQSRGTLGLQGDTLAAMACLAFSPDGKTLVAGAQSTGSQSKACRWNVETGEQRTLLGQDTAVHAAGFLPDGTVVLGNATGTVMLYAADSDTMAVTLPAHSGVVNSLSVLADGKLLATGSADKSVKIWQLG